MANLSPPPKLQFTDLSGNPLVGGKLYTYQAGTNTPQATFTNSSGLIANTNPVILDVYGEASVWLGSNLYKFILTDSANNQIWTVDNIGGISTQADLQQFINSLAASGGSNLVGFLQSGIGAVVRTVQTKLREMISVKDYGAVGDGITDDTSEIQAAIDANPGRNIFFPKGVYSITGITVSNNNTTLIGEGSTTGGSILQPANTTGNDVTFTGCQFSGIENIGIFPIVKKTNGYAVYFTTGAFRCQAVDVNVNYAYNGFGFVNATECVISNSQCRYMLGSRGVYFGGTVSNNSYRLVIDNFGADNPYPNGYGTVKAYATTTAFTLGDIVATNGIIWQCSQSGTTGSTSPSNYPGTTAQTVFSDTITDGTVKWKFVCLSSLYWIVQDSYAYSLVIDKAACLNGARGYTMQDSAATGTSYPIWTFAWDLETDHSYSTGVQMDGGEGLYIDGSWIGSSLSGNGVVIGSSARGEVFIGAGTRIVGHAENGVLIQAGPKTVNIDGCMIGLNSQKTINTYNGITVAAGVIDFSITNNRIGDLVGTGANPQSAGIYLLAGATNQFIIANNNLLNNITAAIIDFATGTTKRIANNLGYNPSIITPIVVGASPFNFTNNTGNDISVFVQAGTVSQINLDGYAVALSTFQSVVVPQGSIVTVTYTVAPVMLYKIH